VVGGRPEAEQRLCIPPGRPHTFWNARNTTELDMGAHPAGPAACIGCGLSVNRRTVCHLTSDLCRW
jgi:hypothetical protein